jgi:hypothetical protein
MIVTLTWDLVREAAKVGVDRKVSAYEHQRTDRIFGREPLNWNTDIWGALPELVVARALDMPWNALQLGATLVRTADVGTEVEVRTCLQTRKINYLNVYPLDTDSARFVLVTFEGRGSTGLIFMIRGWIAGRDGKRPLWWSPNDVLGGAGCYRVHENQLKPFDPSDGGWK